MTRTPPLPARGLAIALLAGSLAGAAAADAVDGVDGVRVEGISGREIYSRVVENRFRSFTQSSRLISADRAGHRQESRFQMQWKDFRSQGGEPSRGILSKTIVKYSHPFDLRFSGYLIQANQGRPNDQFVYYPSRRKVVRVNLRSEAVYGTDFSFEDVIPRELGDFHHRRLPDQRVDDVEVYVVELVPREHADSEYSRIQVFVDRQRWVVLRARYWDAAGVEVKEFRAETGALRELDGVWVTMESTMRNLLLETHTRLVVTEIVANPELDQHTFDLGRLESH